MLLKIFFMNDFEYEVRIGPGHAYPDPKLYRLVESIPLSELGSGIFSAAVELVILSRAPRWRELDNGRRPVRAGDLLSLDGKNYVYSLTCGRQLKNCRFRLHNLGKKIL